MNRELDELLCLFDGKLTAYRQNNTDSKLTVINVSINNLQKEIQRLWELNKNTKNGG